MDKLEMIMVEIQEWSDTTFGKEQRVGGMIAHLAKEVKELHIAYNDVVIAGCNNSATLEEYKKSVKSMHMEIADCLMLLLDISTHSDLCGHDLIRLVDKKLRINKKRKWGKINQTVQLNT